jgi:hypothetical protein
MRVVEFWQNGERARDPRQFCARDRLEPLADWLTVLRTMDRQLQIGAQWRLPLCIMKDDEK